MHFSRFVMFLLILLIAKIHPVPSRRVIKIYPHLESRLGFELVSCTGLYHDNRDIFAIFNGICYDCYRQFLWIQKFIAIVGMY